MSADSGPRGFKPKLVVTWLPPGGFLLDAVLWIYGTCTHLVQAAVLWHHGHPQFACFVLFFMTIALFDMIARGLPQAFKLSKERGLPTTSWMIIAHAKASSESIGAGLVASYAVTLLSQMSTLAGVNSVVGLLLSAQSVADNTVTLKTGAVTVKPGAARREAVKILRPSQYAVAVWWTRLQTLTEFVAFAIAGRVFHPSITAVVCGMQMIVMACFGHLSWRVCCQPHRMYDGIGTPLFGIKDRSNDYPYHKAAPVVVCNIIRFGLLWILITVADFPNGVCQFGTLARPMGSAVFQSEFVDAFRSLQSMNLNYNSTDLGNVTFNSSDFDCSTTECGHIVFNSFLVAAFAVTSPLYLLGSASLFFFAKSYVWATIDKDFEEEVAKVSWELELWAQQRAQGQEGHRPLL